MKTKLVILCGPPGVGKSTYIATRTTENDVVISSDELRKELLGDLNNSQDNLIFKTMVERAIQGLKTIKMST